MLQANEIEKARDLRNWIRNTLPRLLEADERVSSRMLTESSYQAIVYGTMDRELRDLARVDNEFASHGSRVDVVVTPRDGRYGPIAIEIKGPGCSRDALIDDIRKLARLRPKDGFSMGMLLHFRSTDTHDTRLRAFADRQTNIYYRRVEIPRRRA